MVKLPIAMAEDYWANSQFSIARHMGRIGINGTNYVIVNKFGATIFELSDPGSRFYVGDDNMAIPPGEPCDLLREDWVPIYKALGRDEFIKLLQRDITLKEAMQYIKDEKKRQKKSKKNTSAT